MEHKDEGEVVNVKVKFIRPEYTNLEDWMRDLNNEYIGRGRVVFIKNEETGKRERIPEKASEFANPFKIGKDGTREEVIKKYEKYIMDKVENEEGMKEKLITMKNKKLGCWCKPEPCHGDVLLSIVNKL